MCASRVTRPARSATYIETSSEEVHTLRLWPVPASAATEVAWLQPTLANTIIEIVDVSGFVVLRLDLGLLAAGETHVSLNFVDVAGSPLPPGMYLVRVTAGSVLVTSNLVKVN